MKVSSPLVQHQPTLPANIDRHAHAPLIEGVGPRKLDLYRDAGGRVDVFLSPAAPEHLVLSGGGAKGVAFSGMMRALEEAGKLEDIRLVSGSSAGAISGVLIASGMGGDAFDALLDRIDMPSLLNSPDPVTAWLQSASSTLGNVTRRLPGGGILQLFMTLMPRLQTEAPALEAMMRDQARQSILTHIADTPRSTRPAELMKIADRLSAGSGPTFADLATLSRHIPDIKQLNITGTGMFDGRPQLVVFNADLTPDMGIARAAHISGALPVLFKSPLEQGHAFQAATDVSAFQDGGLLVNVPAPDVIERSFPETPLSKDKSLIVQFESEQPSEPTRTGGFFSHLVDTFSGTSHTAADAYQNDRLIALADQTVTLPMNTAEGDFRGMHGTVNFTMTPGQKDHLQAQAYKAVAAHLEKHATVREHHHFATLEQAVLAMDDEMLASVQDSLKNEPAATDIVRFRKEAQQTLQQLDSAICEANQSSDTLTLTSKLACALRNLDALACRPERVEWLSRRLNVSGQRNFQQLLQVCAKGGWDDAPLSKVMRAAVIEMGKRDIAVKAERFTREVIYPSQYRLGQPDSNVDLLQQAAREVAKATTPAEFNQVLDGIIGNYKARNKPWAKPGSATTVEMAKAWRVPV